MEVGVIGTLKKSKNLLLWFCNGVVTIYSKLDVRACFWKGLDDLFGVATFFAFAVLM